MFKPSEYWQYCGGCIAIVAESIEEAIGIGKTEENANFFAEELTEDPPDGFDNWVCAKVFDLSGNVKKGIVFNDWHWA